MSKNSSKLHMNVLPVEIFQQNFTDDIHLQRKLHKSYQAALHFKMCTHILQINHLMAPQEQYEQNTLLIIEKCSFKDKLPSLAALGTEGA